MIYLLGIILIGLLFVIGGIKKIFNFDNMVKSINSKILFNDLPLVVSQLAIVITILILICGPLMMIYGYTNNIKYIRNIGAYLLIFFLVLTLIFYHPPTVASEQTSFLKNTAIIGGLIMSLNI